MMFTITLLRVERVEKTWYRAEVRLTVASDISVAPVVKLFSSRDSSPLTARKNALAAAFRAAEEFA